jgi:hypothetical protein
VSTTGGKGAAPSLGIRQAAFIGVGSMVGAGIFSLLGAAGAVAGAAVWISFLLAGIVAGLQGDRGHRGGQRRRRLPLEAHPRQCAPWRSSAGELTDGPSVTGQPPNDDLHPTRTHT